MKFHFYLCLASIMQFSNTLVAEPPFLIRDDYLTQDLTPTLIEQAQRFTCKHRHRPKRMFKKTDCKRCCQGPEGPQGPRGFPGLPGPALSTAAASFYIPATFDGPNVSVDSVSNFPFELNYFAPQGITYNTTNNNFTFSQTGLYLVSYGASIDETSAFIALFLNNDPLGGTIIPGSQVYVNDRDNLFGTTITVPITDTTQTLSLVNSSGGPLTLHVGFQEALGAYITITRIANLP